MPGMYNSYYISYIILHCTDKVLHGSKQQPRDITARSTRHSICELGTGSMILLDYDVMGEKVAHHVIPPDFGNQLLCWPREGLLYSIRPCKEFYRRL